MIQAVIFDFDGLILDTEISAFQTWQEIFEEYGYKLPFETWAACIGGSAQLFDPCEYLESLLGRSLPRAELRLRRRQRHIEVVFTQPLLPGVQNYLVDAKRLGLKVGLASSSSHEWVDQHIVRLGIASYFDAVKCFDDVSQAKPEPELYLAVLAALQLRPEQAIALEDSPNGIVAAQRAGIFGIAVPNPVTRQLSLEHADLRLTSLEEMSLEQLIALVEDRQQAGSSSNTKEL